MKNFVLILFLTLFGVMTLIGQAQLEVESTTSDIFRGTSSETIGTWLKLGNTSVGGKIWNLLSTGSGNTEGAGHLLIHQEGIGPRMTFMDGGNIGIGTTMPVEKLHVKGSIRYDDGEFQNWGIISIHPDVDNTGDDVVRFLDGAGMENMRIHSNGNFGIGTSSPGTELHIKQKGVGANNGIRLEPSTNSNTWNIAVSENDLKFYYNGVEKGYVDNGTAGFVTGSDHRLKESIVRFDEVLSKVMHLRPSRYYYKDDELKRRKAWGFIAQEVEKVFPELVHQGSVHKGLSYDDFAVLSIKAIQEQQEIIGEQESRIKSLEKEMVELKSLLVESLKLIESK